MDTLYKIEMSYDGKPELVEAEVPSTEAKFAVLGLGNKVIDVGPEGTAIEDLVSYDSRKIYMLGTSQLPHDFVVLPGMAITVADSVANG